MAARYTVVFDRAAESDLSSIKEHISLARDPEFAAAFVDRIIARAFPVFLIAAQSVMRFCLGCGQSVGGGPSR